MDSTIKDVFISHSSKDKPFVRKLMQRLEPYGITMWIDEGEILPGDRIRDKINDGILNSRFLILILSEHSVNSSWVKTEIDSAMIKEIESNEVVVIPILLGAIETGQLPSDLKGKLFLDFRETDKFEENSERLAQSIRKRIDSQYVMSISTIKYHLDILKTDGSEVIYTKKKKFTVLAGNLDSHQEEYYSDGNIEFLEVSPGDILNQHTTLDSHVLILGFGRVLTRGEQFSQTVRALYKNSFPASREYWQTEHVYPATTAEYEFVFPAERPYKKLEIMSKRGVVESEISADIEEFLVDGDRKAFRVNFSNLPLNDRIRMYWDW